MLPLAQVHVFLPLVKSMKSASEFGQEGVFHTHGRKDGPGRKGKDGDCWSPGLRVSVRSTPCVIPKQKINNLLN